MRCVDVTASSRRFLTLKELKGSQRAPTLREADVEAPD